MELEREVMLLKAVELPMVSGPLLIGYRKPLKPLDKLILLKNGWNPAAKPIEEAVPAGRPLIEPESLT